MVLLKQHLDTFIIYDYYWLLVSEPGIFGVSGVFLVKPIWNLVFGPREPSHVVDLAEKIIFVFGIPRIDAKTAPKLTRIIPAKSQPTYPPFSGPSQGQSGWLERWKGWSRRDLLRGTGPGSQKPASRHVLWGNLKRAQSYSGNQNKW